MKKIILVCLAAAVCYVGFSLFAASANAVEYNECAKYGADGTTCLQWK